MKFLVTGGAGFIGRWVTEGLLREGHEVAVLDNLATGSEKNLAGLSDEPGYRGLVRGDVRDRTLMEELQHARYDGYLHLAGSINVQQSLEDPERCLESNVTGTLRVLEAARRNGAKVTLVGTCMVYAPATEGPIPEEHPVRPASPYAASKLAAEQLTLAYARGYGLRTTVVRPFNTYGPFQRSDGEGGVIAVFLGSLLAGRPLQVFGTGEQTRDFLYVTDCADLIIRAALSPAADGQIINGGTGGETAVRDLAALVAGAEGRVLQVPHPHPHSEIMRLICDARRAHTLLGWRPQVSLAEGIARTRFHLEASAGR